MSPDQIFQLSNPLAMSGWLALILSPFAPIWADRIAALAVPLLLSLAYSGLVLAHWAGAQGGFLSLPDVMLLFTQAPIALAGWLHYLAFDLLLGAWAVRTARAENIPHLLVVPCLILTFLFGPAGFLAFSILGLILSQRKTA